MTDATKTCSTCFETIDGRALRCPRCTARQPDAPAFHRNVPGRLMAGVCAAVAQHFDWDVMLVRVAFVVALLATGGLTLWVYGALWVMTPFDANGRSPAQRLAEGISSVFSTPKSPEPAKSPEQG